MTKRGTANVTSDNVWLLTGGSGRLGTELQKLRKFYAPSSKELDITGSITSSNHPLVLHAAAYTAVDKAETDTEECFKLNVGGTARMAEAYKNTPFVFISSEHAYKPINMYCASKFAAEEVVAVVCEHYLIIRTLFKPRPYPFDNAWQDQITQGDYTDTIAKLIIEAIESWDKKSSKTILVGTGRKSIFDLAKQTVPNVRPSSIHDYPGAAKRPSDYK
jgi:dTDP-4-dehydrorhamnose reductase